MATGKREGEVMKRCVYVILVLFLTGCFSRTAMMSKEDYDSVTVGTTMADLEAKVGRPDAVHSKGPDRQELEYVERIGMNTYYSIENKYFIEVMNGIVVGKRMLSRRSPAYEFMYQSEPNFSPDYSAP